MTISRELLAAYADGELNGRAAADVEAVLASDPQLQAQLDAHRRLKERLGSHFAPLMDEPVPDQLRTLLTGGDPPSNVVAFPSSQSPRPRDTRFPRWTRFAGPALAASLVLAFVGIGLQQQTPQDYAQGEIAAALEGQLVADQAAQAPVRILLSFRDRKGDYCRGFATAAQSGIACQDGRGWRLETLVGGTRQAASEYRQAGSPEAAIMGMIQEKADGPALDEDEERAARQRGWRSND